VALPSSDNAVQVWSATTGKPIHPTAVIRGNRVTTWSPTGNRIASSSTDYTVQVWDATTGQHPSSIAHIPGIYGQSAWSPMKAPCPEARWHNPAMGTPFWAHLPQAIAPTQWGRVYSVVALDGRRIATASDDDTRIWTPPRQARTHLARGHASYVRAVAWSPDGSSIALAAVINSAGIIRQLPGNGSSIGSFREDIWSYGHLDGYSIALLPPDLSARP